MRTPLALLAALPIAACSPSQVTPVATIEPVRSTPVAPVESVSVVLLVSGAESWIGNDDYEPEIDPADPSGLNPNPGRSPGSLKPLAHAIDTSKLASLRFPGEAELVIYTDWPRVLVADRSIRDLRGSDLGYQRQYDDSNGVALVRGVELALDRLAESGASRRAVVIIGDGTNTDMAARNEVRAARAAARREGVDLYSIVHKGPHSADGDLTIELVPSSHHFDAKTAEDLRQALLQIKGSLEREVWRERRR